MDKDIKDLFYGRHGMSTWEWKGLWSEEDQKLSNVQISERWQEAPTNVAEFKLRFDLELITPKDGMLI